MIIVGDTRKDKRFRQAAVADDGSRIQFYASFPIESPEGVLVANLCVTAPSARNRSQEVDVVSLRSLAQICLRELWEYLPSQGESRNAGLL